MEKGKLINLQRIKWSIILKTNSSLALFAQTIEKLLMSIDPKRTEIILLQEAENKLILNTFSTYCEKVGIPYNYGDNYTHALSLAKGQYVVFMTDAVFVSKNFLIKLTFCMENFDREGKTTLVSPISNDIVAGLALTPDNLDDVQGQFSKQPKEKVPWTQTLKVASFCLMVKRDYFQGTTIADFAAQSYQLNSLKDLVLEINERGLYTVAANDTLVYHFPEALDNIYLATPQLVEQKLAVIYRIKIDNEYFRDIFVKSLTKSIDLADNIYVLDANSKIKMSIYLKDNYHDLWCKITKFEKFSRPYDERHDYNDLISWAEKDGCTWVFSLTGDEMVEDKVDRNYIQRFLTPTNPEVMGYRANHYHFWDDENHWRYDAPWGRMNDVRLTRILPDRRITDEGIVAGLCGYTIKLPNECIRETSIRIKNYGYIKAEYRQERREFYEGLGIKNIPNFEHLTKENGLFKYKWIEDSTVSFYTPTNRGGEVLYNWLDTNAYFADQVVLGNDSNVLNPHELELCKTYPNVMVIPIEMGDNFGKGRNTLLGQCTCDNILQLDVDETLDNLADVRRMIDITQYDAWMFTIPNIQKNGQSVITETIRLFKNKDGVYYWGKLHETIDQHVKKVGWKLSKSPVKITHFGYTLQNADEAYKKMQRYLKINLLEMKENPMYGMPYYSVALHLIEDNLIDDAIKLLELAVTLQPGFALAGLELGKCYIRKANQWVGRSLKVLGPNHFVSAGFKQIQDTLTAIEPKHFVVAKGHCLGYFTVNQKEATWMREHVLKMEKTIENMKIKQMEKGKAQVQ